MAQLCVSLKQRFFDANGNPLVGGKLYSYEAGTTTPLATYTDQSGGVENANPVILDANGEADVWIGNGAYKFVLYDANDNLQWSVDDVNLLGDDSVLTAKIADGAVTAAKLSTDSVTTIKIQNGAVTTAKIADSNVTTAKIADSNVTTAKIADGNVTDVKIASVGHAISSDSGNDVITGGSDSQIDNCSVTITANGSRMIKVGLVGTVSQTSRILATQSGATTVTLTVYFKRGSTVIGEYPASIVAVGSSGTRTLSLPPSAFFCIDEPSAGSHTYTAHVITPASTTANIDYVRLYAMEIVGT